MTRRTITKGLQIAPRPNAGFGATRAASSACVGMRSPRASAGENAAEVGVTGAARSVRRGGRR